MDHAYGELKEINNISLNLRGLTPSYKAYKELLAQPNVQELIKEAEKGRVDTFDKSMQLDQIFERRPTA